MTINLPRRIQAIKMTVLEATKEQVSNENQDDTSKMS